MTNAVLIVGALIVAVILFRNRGRTPPPSPAKGSGGSTAPGSGAARSQSRSAPPPRGLAGFKAAWRLQMKAIHRSVGIIVFVLVVYFALIFIREFL
jgi:hypothetical protein